MHVTLTLKAKQTIAINNVLSVEKVRIGQPLLFMIQVDEVRRYLCYLGDVLQQLYYSAVNLNLHLNVLSLASFEGVDSDVDCYHSP